MPLGKKDPQNDDTVGVLCSMCDAELENAKCTDMATAVLGLSDVDFSDNPVVAVGQLDMRLREGPNNLLQDIAIWMQQSSLVNNVGV